MQEKNKRLINVTDITSWLYCPRKLWLCKIKKLKQPLNKPMLVGKLKHDILDRFSKTENQIISNIQKDYDRLELFLIYENQLKKIAHEVFLKNHKIIQAFHLDRAEIFKKVLEDFSEDIKIRIESIKKTIEQGFIGEGLWKNLTPKYISEVKIESPSLGIKGRIDRVEIDNENKIFIPYELKTREGRIFYSDEIQLTAYAMLLEDQYNISIKEGVIESGSNKQKIKIKQENKERVLEIADNIRNLVEDIEPQLPSNFNKCRNCGFRKYCM